MERRLSFAVLVAVVVHTPMVLLGWLPWSAGLSGSWTTGTGDHPGVQLRLESVSRAATLPGAERMDTPHHEDILPVDYRPRLGQAPRLNPVAEVPPLIPVPGGAGMPSSPKAAGTPGSSGLFRVATTARRVVFVVDRSVSMGLQGMLQQARLELADALEHLSSDAWFQIILYHQSARPLLGPLPGTLQPADAGTIRRAIAALPQVTAEGGTNHLAGVQAALAMQPDVVVLITDEDDLTEQDERAILRANRGARFEVIEMRRGEQREGAFARLARATGGSHRRFLPQNDR